MRNDTNELLGIDFSGGVDCGRKIWIARAESGNDGRLELRECQPLKDLCGAHTNREVCFPVLVDYIASHNTAVIGCDFPFGIPVQLMKDTTWERFINGFADRFESPESFRDWCRQSLGREVKRKTDIEAQTPFSPYNLRLYRQTYYGIRDILYPLVKDGIASVLPMQAETAGKPVVAEVCPSSTLRQFNMHREYKGSGAKAGEQRSIIIDFLKEHKLIRIDDDDIHRKIVSDNEGDALDSVVAAIAASSVPSDIRGITDNHQYMLEGYVFGW